MLLSMLRGVLELVAPPVCAACVGAIETRALTFCAACEPLIDEAPVPAGVLRDRSACMYGGPLRDALHLLKYSGYSELAPGLAQWLIEPAQVFAGAVDVVTAVPLHPSRLRARGFNQSVLLARPVARSLGLPLRPSLLKRVREGGPQVGRGRAARTDWLAGAMKATARARGQRVLVVDDVRTTGATLEEARRALRAAGAHAVYTLTLALADDSVYAGDASEDAPADDSVYAGAAPEDAPEPREDVALEGLAADARDTR